MARTGRPKAALVLTPAEQEQLTRWARRASSSQALALRSKIVLAAAEGLSNNDVAERVGCEPHTVSKWRRRFVEKRLDGLGDEKRPGRPATITLDQVEDVINTGVDAAERDALDARQDGTTDRAVEDHDWEDLVGLLDQAAPGRALQAVDRSAGGCQMVCVGGRS